MSINKKHVVIIGGGYGGLRLVEKLLHTNTFDITLIDKNPYHYLQTEAYGYIAGRFEIKDIAIDLKNWCAGFGDCVEFIQKKVTSIDFKSQCIKATDASTLLYDYVVIATGAKTNFFASISGLEKYSHGIKTLQRAYEFRRKFEDIIYKALENKSLNTHKPSNIVIGGAGLSGVEIAAEMAYVIQKYAKTIGENTHNIHIYLIDASQSILPGMSEYVKKHTENRLLNLGVTIYTDTYIDKVDANTIYFKNNKSLTYFFMVFTGGIVAEVPQTDIKDKNNIDQYLVTDTLNIIGYDNAFAIGDCVEIRDKNNNIVPPTAQLAEKSAEYIADTILKHTSNKHIKTFDVSLAGMFIALGGHYAVGEMYNVIKSRGYMAHILKKLVTYSYVLGLRLRINTGYKNRIKESPT